MTARAAIRGKMEDMENKKRNNHQQTGRKDPCPPRKPVRNPRIVLADPDDFFNDLLMEQQEQQ